MPAVRCDVPGCEYTTADMGNTATAVQLTHHIATVYPIVSTALVASTKKLDWPTIAEEVLWSEFDLFLFQWRRYKHERGEDKERALGLLLE